jgi:cytochrome c oxidase assembly protein subunit 15
MSAVLIVLVSLTILAGGFVAGLKAGLTYNTFPLMDGHLVPEGYGALQPWWKNLFENIPAVQFDHRVLATGTALFALFVSAFGKVFQPYGGLRTALAALGIAVFVQYLLGVTTLLYVVPVSLGTLHQVGAVALLSVAIALRHFLRR